mgnify:FL=1
MNDQEHEFDGNEFKIHEGIVLIVHLSPTMYSKLGVIFQTFLNLLKNLMKTMPHTGLGLYLGNCTKENDQNSSSEIAEGIYRVFRLQDLNERMLMKLNRCLTNVKSMESFLEGYDNESEKWKKMFPLKDSNVEESFGHALYSLLHQSLADFNNIPMRTEEYTSKKVFLFTDCFTPFNDNEQIKQRVQSKLRDLNDSKVTVYPFPLRQNTQQSFVKSEVETSFVEEDSVDLRELRQLFDFPMDFESKKFLPNISEVVLESLEEKIMKYATVRRLLFQCPLIFKDIKIAVKGINPFTSVEWKKVNLYNYNNRLQYAIRKSVPQCNNKDIKKNEICKAYQIADQYMPVDKQIQNDCMKFGEKEKPILHVIGTRKFEYFNPSYIINKASFMIADEDKEPNDSQEKFAALYKSLYKKKMMVLCWGMPRKVSYPRFYYLIPTSIMDPEPLSLERYPHSLAMIEVPFGNEIRKAPEFVNQLDSTKEINDSHLLDSLIKASIIDKFKTFSNPSLAWKFKVMEDHLLQVEVPQNEEELNLQEKQLELDEMFQSMEETKRKIEKSKELTQVIDKLSNKYNQISNYNELKRTEEDVDTPNVKKVKKQDSNRDILNDVKCALHYHNSKLKNCTNDMLRLYIKSKGGMIKTGKNKGEMISNIVEYLEKNQLI